ncbi:MAG: glycoside hydrolase family 3 C-terminal domain-containing protein [Bifidobacteriaceae bacterium]|jgi:beta-glucosidase|nr:glycoside hydrolase family 3 C-terminal domain-containing protein [Bifidobacteriaceae bacterium]
MSESTTRRRLGLARGGRAGLTLALSVGLVATGVTALNLPAASADTPAYLDTNLSADERAADLVSRLTLDEKVLQLNAQTQTSNLPNPLGGGAGVAPPIDRLGVGAYAWWSEALHGVARSGGNTNNGGRATELPTGLSMASTWNRDLVFEMETIVSDEARAFANFYSAGASVVKHKGLSYWSPTINMHRDPRWGRAEETYGEDPFLTGEIGKEFVWGMQGATGPNRQYGDYYKTGTTPKHYLANNSETNRHNGSAELTEAEIREYYTPAFAALTGSVPSDGAKSRSVMTAYNHVNGVPMSGSREYLETFARRTWGFDGVVISDCDAIRDSWWPGGNGNLWQPDGIALTQRTGVAYTLKAGTDLDCMDGDYSDAVNGLVPSLKDGNLTEADVDVAVFRAFRERFLFGEFDNFYADTPWGNLALSPQYGSDPANRDVDNWDSRDAAKRGAKEATVLLKNDGVLPLDAPAPGKKYVVVGHMGLIPVHGDYSPAVTYNQLLSAQQAVKDYVADVDPGASVEYIWGMNRDELQLGRKKPNFGRNQDGSNSVVRFFRSNSRVFANETVRVNAETIIKSMDYDGWRGVAPWSGSKTNPSQGYTTLQSYGAWGGYFAVTTEIPADSVTMNVDYAVTNGSTYNVTDTQGNITSYCRTSANIPGRLNVHLGDRDGPLLGTVTIAAPTQICSATSPAPNFPTDMTAQLIEAVPGRLAALAGTTTRLVFEWESDYFQADLSGDYNENNIPDSDEIANADAVIVYTGTTSMQSVCLTNPTDPSANCGAGTGSGGTGNVAYDSSEDEDRSSIDLPRAQDDLIDAVAQLNPRTIAWIQSVSQVDVSKFEDSADAIIWTSYNGEFQGLNVPYTVFGRDTDLRYTDPTLVYGPDPEDPPTIEGAKVDPLATRDPAIVHVPSGKLPFTWYEDIKDLGDAKDYQMTPDASHNGRTYQYFTGPVDYPFGFGLSYASFTYGAPTVTSSSGSLADVTPNDTLTVAVPVTNTSATFPGKTVVQVYASSPRAGEALRPDQQLKGFAKTAELGPNDTETVSIDIKAKDLWFWDSAADRKTYDLGEWTLKAGSSAAAADLQDVNFTMTGALNPAIENVVAVPDGLVLNTAAPNSAIHANLSVSRNDQSFYDLAAGEATVVYSSSDPAVATVDANGTVLPAGAGVATITAAATADGDTVSTSFAVAVYEGVHAGNGERLFQRSLDFGDASVPLSQARAGAQLNATLVGAADADVKFYAARGEANTADATVGIDGVLRATKAGVVRVTALASDSTGFYSHTATVTVAAGAGDPETEAVQLVEAIADAEDALAALDPNDFTPASLEAIQEAIDAAQATLTAPGATQAQIDAAAVAVAEAVATLATPRGDVTLIAPAVAAAQVLAEMADSYTPETWAAVSAAVTRGVAMIAAADPNTSADDVSAAIAAISGALDALAPAVDNGTAAAKAEVEALISAASTVFPAGSLYTSATWATYQAALTAANSLVGSPAAGAGALATAKANLEAAIAGLAVRPSTAPLVAVIDVARAVSTSGYTPASVAQLSGAIAAAGSVVSQGEPTAAAIQSAIAAINAALGGLELAPVEPPAGGPGGNDPGGNQPNANAGAGAALASLVEAVTSALPSADQYTAASWAAYQTALAQARAAGSGDTPAATAARNALQAAVNGLTARASTSGLVASIDAAKAVKPAGYSAASVAALNAALAAAEALAAPAKADTVTAAEVSAAQAALNAALAGLVIEKVEAGPNAQPPVGALSSATPKIKGTVKVGKTLKITKGTWTKGASFTYRWYANGKAIKGATKASLKLKAAQKGKKITVRVTGKLAGYNKVSKTSKATKAVK